MPQFQASKAYEATSAPILNSTDLQKQESQATITPASNSRPKKDRIRIKNRRKRYLDLHPEYFTSTDLELSDPLLYDRLVRCFQTAQERESQGRQKASQSTSTSTSAILETSFLRSEAKLEALKFPTLHNASGLPTSKSAAWELWIDIMTQKFLEGKVEGFEYEVVDEGEEFDDSGEEERGVFEGYVDEQTPEFIGDGVPKGETGVQDLEN